jgi:membrane-associated protease RseP (regulator of RpoE activity)
MIPIYDLSFIIIFTIFIGFFLYKRRKNLERQGIIFLYKMKLGIQSINWVGDKYRKLLGKMKYLIISIGFLLMAGIIYLLAKTSWIYIKFPEITKIIKAPPVFPVIPYFDKILGIDSLFPDFTFTYFIIAFLIVAFVHEFSHGIFMRAFKIKIKATGFVFLGPILGAFVEEDRKNFEKAKNSEQMTILGAGVFANILFALIFWLLLAGFFTASFTPGGYVFDSYSTIQIPANQISSFGDVENATIVLNGQTSVLEVNKITAVGKEFYLSSVVKKTLEVNNLTNSSVLVGAFDNSPAFSSGLNGIIVDIDNIKINNQEGLREFLETRNPGEVIQITTLVDNEERTFSLTLGQHPLNDSLAYIGIGHSPNGGEGVIGSLMGFFTSFEDKSTYYVPTWDGDAVYFIKDLLWWVAIINLFVALFNMLPLGILDGGRFFYLAVLSLTKSKKVAKKSFKFISFLILLLFLSMVFFWAFSFF